MKQELPQLVDERRFRRREQEQVERDEYGRVCLHLPMIIKNLADVISSANGLRRRSRSPLKSSLDSTFVRRLLAMEVRM